MSWNKNTVNCSEVYGRVKVLKECLQYHILTKIGRVVGQGLNDHGDYDLFQLEYKDSDGVTHILRQQMQRTQDCDSDDYIIDLDVSDKSPSYILNIPLEITLSEDMEYL